MFSLFKINKNLILYILALGIVITSPSVWALEDELTDRDILETPIEEETPFDDSTMYINDIEILGANIIKPEFILKKMQLQKGDLYDKNVMQSDLKTIYKLGYFTERMKAVPVKNENLRILPQ